MPKRFTSTTLIDMINTNNNNSSSSTRLPPTSCRLIEHDPPQKRKRLIMTSLPHQPSHPHPIQLSLTHSLAPHIHCISLCTSHTPLHHTPREMPNLHRAACFNHAPFSSTASSPGSSLSIHNFTFNPTHIRLKPPKSKLVSSSSHPHLSRFYPPSLSLHCTAIISPCDIDAYSSLLFPLLCTKLNLHQPLTRTLRRKEVSRTAAISRRDFLLPPQSNLPRVHCQ